ncbi:50S ribosomal protein L16 [Candidatus Woesearchaeota archaeon]|nr:50S ribosomal protein L16 [Candidatus Woesearchaeota archaeon]
MVGLRKGRTCRKIERAYTRRSKYKKKSFIKAIPANKVVKYQMGDTKKTFPYIIELLPKVAIQIRHNAIESARQVVNRRLEITLKGNYLFQVRTYPHQVIREHKMLTGAQCDRLSPGMAHAFGKPIGLAAQLKKLQPLLSVSVDKENLEKAKTALDMARSRLPGSFYLVTREEK